MPGVARVEHVTHANVELPGQGLIALAAGDGDTKGFEVYEGESLADARRNGHVMVGPALARGLDLKPGATFTMPGRFGPVSLVVGGIWAAPDTLGRSITTTIDVFERIAGPRPVDWVLLVPEPGLSPAELAGRVRAAGLAPNLMVFDPDELTSELAHDFEGFIAPFTVLTRGLLVVAFIATASTLLLAGVKRKAEHGLLAAVGMPPGDLGRMILVEAGLFGIIGTLCGLFGGVLAAAALVAARPQPDRVQPGVDHDDRALHPIPSRPDAAAHLRSHRDGIRAGRRGAAGLAHIETRSGGRPPLRVGMMAV